MSSIQLSPNSRSFLQVLNLKSIEYLLVGGFAVRYYGYSRPTRDLDVWINTSPENARKIIDALTYLTIDDARLTASIFQHPNRIVRISLSPANVEILDPIIGQRPSILEHFEAGSPEQIEILTVQSGLEFCDCYKNRVIAKLDGIEINVISLDDLKKVKQTGDRLKDRDDLNNMS